MEHLIPHSAQGKAVEAAVSDTVSDTQQYLHCRGGPQGSDCNTYGTSRVPKKSGTFWVAKPWLLKGLAED